MVIDTQTLLLISGALVFVSIIASILSDWMGMPTLLVFLGIGMLAGSDGPGGILFDNAYIANFIGVIALAYILFAGGLDTNWRIVRPVFGRGAALSTIGVVLTAGLVGAFAWGVLGFELVPGLLLGAIISSTDAAAVFSVLRGRGVSLKGDLKPLLEFESGSNDPMAVFLTLSLIQLLTAPDFSGSSFLISFLLNAILGAGVGLLSGKLAGMLFNWIRLEYEGLYPVLSMSLVLLTFGTAEAVGGNGFLAVYLCGMWLNGSRFVNKRHVVRFQDSLAWLMQIVMFLVLGLLVFPSQLLSIAPTALLIVLFLMFVARPTAVAVCLAGSVFNWRERALVSWTGLRGAVPIILATFPLLAGYEQSELLFNIVFFIVLISVAVQGVLLMPIARWLKVAEAQPERRSFSLEVDLKGHAQGEAHEIEILPNMASVGKAIMDLRLPSDVLVLLIGRGGSSIVPKGQTIIQPYDTLLMLVGNPQSLESAHDAVIAPPQKQERVREDSDPLSSLPYTTDEKYLSKQVVLAGYGSVGKRVFENLTQIGVACVVIDSNRNVVEDLRDSMLPAVLGDASEDITLVQAHLMKASVLIITIPDMMKTKQIIDTARKINPDIRLVIRADDETEDYLLEKEEAKFIVQYKNEIAAGISRRVLEVMKS